MKTSVLRSFSKYVSLNILGMIGLSGYILADTFFIAKALGATGLVALNLSISIYSIIHGLGLMIGIGGAIRFSMLKAQKERTAANIVFSNAVKLSIVIGLILTLVGLVGTKNLALLLGADEMTLPLVSTYLMTILSFAPLFMLNNVVLAFVRNDNHPKLAMIAMLMGSFSNIILDYLFMFTFDMGMFGAALATSLAPIISMGVLVFHFISKKNDLIYLRHPWSWQGSLDILKLGLSAFIIEISSAVALINFNLVILGISGNVGVAAYGIVANLALVGVAIFSGLAQGIQPLTSKYYGMKNFRLLKQIGRYTLVTTLAIGVVIYFAINRSSEWLVRIFNSENNLQVAQLATEGLELYFIGFFFVGLNIVAAMFFSTIEKTRDAFIITLSRGILLIVPMLFLLSERLGMQGVWLSFVFTELVVTVFVIYRMLKSSKKAVLY